MRWRFPIFVSSVLFAFVFGLFITTGDTYAISDLIRSFSANDSFTSGTALFPDCNSACLGNYKYLIVSYSSANYLNSNNLTGFNWRPGYGSQRQIYIPSQFSLIIYDLSFESNSGAYLNFNYSGTFTNDVTFTLTEDYNSCPEIEPCPVVPENPYDDKLDSLIQAIYVVAGTLLVLYFFYCIYRLIIRNSGVK